jgi:nucleoside diphosphate kinase
VNTQMNAVHGSDSVENAHKEVNFFFSSFEVY